MPNGQRLDRRQRSRSAVLGTGSENSGVIPYDRRLMDGCVSTRAAVQRLDGTRESNVDGGRGAPIN